MRKALTLYKEGQRLNSESFSFNNNEEDDDVDEADDIGDPYDYLAFLFMSCLQRRPFQRSTDDKEKQKKLRNFYRNEFKEIIKVCSDRLFSTFFQIVFTQAPKTINKERKQSRRRYVYNFYYIQIIVI